MQTLSSNRSYATAWVPGHVNVPTNYLTSKYNHREKGGDNVFPIGISQGKIAQQHVQSYEN